MGFPEVENDQVQLLPRSPWLCWLVIYCSITFTIGLSELMHTMQVQRQALESVAATLLASQGDTVLQSHGVSAMLALVGCDTRPIGPGVYDVNSTDKEGCTVLHRSVTHAQEASSNAFEASGCQSFEP